MLHAADNDSFEGVAAVKYTGSDVEATTLHPVSCDVKSSLTRTMVVLDAHWSDVTSAQRVAILRRFAEHLQLPVSLISLLPAENAIEVGWCEITCKRESDVNKFFYMVLNKFKTKFLRLRPRPRPK